MMAGLPLQQSMLPAYSRMSGVQVRGPPMGNRSAYGQMQNNHIGRSQSNVQQSPAAYTVQARNMPQTVNDLLFSLFRSLFPSVQSRILLDSIVMLLVIQSWSLVKNH